MTTSGTLKPVDVAIVGGGIGGLCLAVHLTKLPNLNVQVYEAAAKFSEVGAGISIGPNAQQAIQMLGGDVEHAFQRIATQNLSEEFKEVYAEVKYGQGPHKGQLVTTMKNSSGQCTAHRAHFLDEFVRLVPHEKAHFGKKLVEVQDLGSDGVEMRFKDGSTAKADCIIGAEGIHSATRAYIMGADHPGLLPEFSGFVAFRAIVPMEEARKVLDERTAANSKLEVGLNNGIFHYPIDHGNMMNIIVTRAQSEWNDQKWILPADHTEFMKVFDDWTPECKRIVQLMDRPGLSKWALWDLMSAPTFHKGRVIMMGDAAHAPTPFHGQGAGQAIEDSLVLGKLFEKVTDINQIQPAFEAYNRVRRIRALKNVETSRADAAVWNVTSIELLHDRDELKTRFDAMMGWLWDRDLQVDVDEAQAIFDDLAKKNIVTA